MIRNRGIVMRALSRSLALCALTLACQPALAVRIDWSAELGLLHSDNIALSPSNPISENVLIPSLAFSISESGSSVQAEVSGVVEYRDYLDDTFASEFRGSLNGLVSWTLIPERLNWVFADTLGLYPISLRDPAVPGNLQQTNVFTTGPTWRFRLTPTLLGQAELRYIDSHAEEASAFDSQRHAAALRGLYDISATQNVGLNLEYQQIDFDEALAQDYRNLSAFLSYRQSLSQIDFDASLGYTRVDFETSPNASGPLASASLDWRASERSTFGIGIADRFTDAASSIGGGSADFDAGFGGVDVGGTAITADVFRERRVDASYLLQATRLNLATLLRYGTYRYEQEPAALANDRDEFGAGVNLGYLLRPTLTLGATAEAIRREFDASDLGDRSYRYGLYLTQRMSRQLSWRIDLARNERHSDEDDDSYDENSIYLRFTYTR
jgi:hypothetical protein